MDSHSRSASPREPARPQHRPPSPPSPAGFDNRAYQHDEADPNHNDSFSSNLPQNGHKPNGDTKTLEAVNLELINLTPKNGAKKKDVEVDMNATNPYDEYFVPVNEHRKYMRGEKLYVTADKRGEKAGCKRPLCWTLLGLVVAVIVALIVLAATGILFSNSPTPLEQYNASVSSARAFGGIGSENDAPLDHNHDHTHHHHEQTTAANDPSSKAQENEAHETLSDETDINMYIPRTVEGELRIDNEEFVPALQDPESEEYREFTSIFNNALKRAVFDKNDLDTNDNEIILEVIQIRNGSVIVTYRIHWVPKHNSEPNEDLLTANTLRSNLDNYLARNNRMISVYHVAEESVNARPVLDMCKVNNNDCEHGCEFDETTLDFTCTCPVGQITDIHSPTKCINILDTTQPRSGSSEESKTLNYDPNGSSVNTISEEDKLTTESSNILNNNRFDWKETNYDPRTTTTESEPELNFSHIFGHENEQNDSEPETKSESESTVVQSAEPSAEPEPTAEPNLSVEPAAAPSLQPEPNAEPEPNSEPEPNAEPEPTVPNPGPEPTAEPNAEPEPAAEPNPEPEPKAEPDSTSQPKSESELIAKPRPEPETTAEPQPKPEPTAEPQPEPEPTVERKPEPEVNQEIEHNTELEINQEAEPNSEINLPTTASPQPLPTAESSPEPEPSHNNHSNLPHEIFTYLDSHESQSKTDITTESNQPMVSIYQTMSASEPRTNHRGTEIESELFSMDDAKFIPQMTTDINIVTEPIFKNDGDSHIEIENEHEFKSEITPNLDNENKETEDMEKSLLVKSSDSSSEDNIFKNNENNQSPISVETTTARVTISNLNSMNEPIPEIITVLKNKQEYTTVSSSNEETTTEGDWLQNDNVDSPLLYTNKPMSNLDTEIYEKISNNKVPATERSSKSFTENLPETVTQTNENQENDVITFDHIHKIKTESSSDMEMNTPPPLTTEESSIISDKKNNEPLNKQSVNLDNINAENINEMSFSDINKTVISLNTDSKNQDLRTTTVKSETGVYSINKDYKIEDENRNFMDALGKPQLTTSTEKINDEVMANDNEEVSFDAINSLYNRSSKSIENEKNDYVKTTTTNRITSEIIEATTESDWLSETVTEVNYEDVMRKSENHETTELSISEKVDETISRNLNKDDFEPDYLNNMGSNNSKMSDQDEPLYGIVHDYDNEDPRVKRVNPEQKTENISSQNITEKVVPEMSIVKSDPQQTETTTVSEYIYKTAEKAINDITNSMVPATLSNDQSTLATITPAPVWEEHENNARKTIIIKEIANETAINYTNSPNIDIPISTSSSIGENSSQVNNLGVTIYEVPSQGINQTTTSPKTINSPTNEYEDHETEMNPFLPEVENNKVLVKKLQEGHDLEPTGLNETQNESGDEHNLTNTDTKTNTMQASTNDANIETTQPNIFSSQAISETDKPLTESDRLFNDLLMHANSNEEESTTKTDLITPPDSFDVTTRKDNYEVLPISTFLLDTDDLDDTQTLSKTTLPGNSLNNESPTEYLSVVPILEKESIKKNYKSENLQELNSINDSSKKSDRRTLDVTNADSLINNEA